MNTHVRDNFLETAPAKAAAAGEYFMATAANTITIRTINEDFENTSETTTSTSYTDLATVGPTVSATASTRAIVSITARVSNSSSAEESFIGVDLTSATTQSPSDNFALQQEGGATNVSDQKSYVALMTGLSAGSTQFRMKYRVTGGTGTFHRRRLMIMPF
jgi:hypothetical protein